jgi:hypothetical protein
MTSFSLFMLKAVLIAATKSSIWRRSISFARHRTSEIEQLNGPHRGGTDEQAGAAQPRTAAMQSLRRPR